MRPRSLRLTALLAADDDVVQKLDAQELGRLRQLTGDRHVLGARRRVVRRVVVADDDAGDGLDHGGPEHLGGPDDGRRYVPLVDHPLADDVVLGVQKQHPKLLLGQLRTSPAPADAANVIGRGDGGKLLPWVLRVRRHLVAHRQLPQQAAGCSAGPPAAPVPGWPGSGEGLLPESCHPPSFRSVRNRKRGRAL